MIKSSNHPELKIKTIFTPSNFVCLLALSLCSTTPITSALPILPTNPSSASSDSNPPFHTISRPVTIQLGFEQQQQRLESPNTDTLLLELLTQRVEQHERFLRQNEQDPVEFARLQHEQDELEKIEQDRDQLLDNQEEEQLDQDPEAVRRRQEESLGLWMTDADFDLISTQEEDYPRHQPHHQHENCRFDLYAEDFKEVPSRSRSFWGKEPEEEPEEEETPSEEQMLRWPITNLNEFEPRQDGDLDEFDELA
ncbi:hypothetical protein BGZ49_004650 [Haplosporangium sp. Z 27]|nr:hypothetical protein BGZ49_004650 [Haplosporangium sp. Z 27]